MTLNEAYKKGIDTIISSLNSDKRYVENLENLKNFEISISDKPEYNGNVEKAAHLLNSIVGPLFDGYVNLREKIMLSLSAEEAKQFKDSTPDNIIDALKDFQKMTNTETG